VRALLGAALVAALLAGCGSSSSDGPDGPTPQEAKAKLRLACLQGSHDRLDRRLCRCIVAEASRRPEFDTPAKLVALSRRTAAAQGGDTPDALRTVARRCADRVAGGG